jgi:hypothetical protein
MDVLGNVILGTVVLGMVVLGIIGVPQNVLISRRSQDCTAAQVSLTVVFARTLLKYYGVTHNKELSLIFYQEIFRYVTNIN